MLDPEPIWVLEFKKLSPQQTGIQGFTKMAEVIEKLTNKVDPSVPGGTATPGIFKWNKAAFIAQVATLAPTATPEWANTMSNAWAAACTSGVITPGLVSAPSLWLVSSVDVNTLPAAATTVPTITVGQALLLSGLLTVPGLMSTNPAMAPEAFAKAFRAAVAAFTFNLIGIAGTPASPVPLPVPATAI
jgi:hypothetical protein